MVDYSYYYVQPNQSQGFSALNNAIQFKKETDQRDFHNKLLERGTNMEMQRGERAERRLDLQEKREMSESDWKLLGMQADFLSRVLEPAVDDETFQVSRRAIESVAVDDKGQPTPMAKSEFFQSIYRTMPEKFDPEKINKAKSVFNSLSKKAAEKAHGSHQTFYDEKGTPYRKWVNAGEDLVLPPGHKTGDQIKADAAQKRKETTTSGSGGASPDDKKAKTEITAMSEIRKIYADMKDPKKGIGWKPGKEIPPEYLDHINSLRKAINKPPLTKKEAEIQAEVSIFSPSTWDGKESGVTYTEDGSGQSTPASGAGVDIGSLIERGKKLRSR